MADIRIDKTKLAQDPIVIKRDMTERAQALLDQIDEDLDGLAAATTSQTKIIIGRMLRRQRRIIQYIAKNG